MPDDNSKPGRQGRKSGTPYPPQSPTEGGGNSLSARIASLILSDSPILRAVDGMDRRRPLVDKGASTGHKPSSTRQGAFLVENQQRRFVHSLPLAEKGCCEGSPFVGLPPVPSAFLAKAGGFSFHYSLADS